MKKKILPLVLAASMTLCGCASLLERSYSSVEPYTDRYWDSGVEDTLKAESYQDLVNSLLMLIEQHREEVVIRYYAPEGMDGYSQAISAKHEVKNETILGSYLLDSLTLSCTEGEGYCTLVYSMTYRRDAQDISSLMALSDSQSLVDLLRLAVREGHDSLTAQFITDISREDILAAVDQLWQELYLDELEASGALAPPPSEDGTETPPEGDASAETGSEPAETPDTGENAESEESSSTGENSQSSESTETGKEPESGENTDGTETGEQPPKEPEPPVIEFPPCPWEIIFYPNADTAEIVEIVLK